MLELKVKGELCSKSNSRRIVRIGGKPRLIKSQKALDYEAAALIQLKPQLRDHTMYEGYLRLEVHVWYASKRPDLDVTLIQDTLEHAGVYKNDRSIVEIHAFKYWDKTNPRILVRISEVDESELKL